MRQEYIRVNHRAVMRSGCRTKFKTQLQATINPLMKTVIGQGDRLVDMSIKFLFPFWEYVCVYDVCACLQECGGLCVPQCTFESQRVISGFCPCFSPCLRRVFVNLCVCQAGWAFSCLCLPSVPVLGLQVCDVYYHSQLTWVLTI